MINQQSILFGLILGAISLAINILLYVANPSVMVQGIVGLLTFIAIIVLWVLFANKVRKANNDSFTFKEAFTSLFIIGAISMLIGMVWQLLLAQVIDPEYSERMIESSIQMAESFGGAMTEEQITGMKDQYTLKGQLVGGLWGILVMAVLSLIVALMIKKQPSQGALDAA